MRFMNIYGILRISLILTSILWFVVAAKMVDQLLQMPLSEEEERHLVEYLKTSRESNSSELLVMYYLQRSRFIEAIRLNNKLKHSIMVTMDSTI